MAKDAKEMTLSIKVEFSADNVSFVQKHLGINGKPATRRDAKETLQNLVEFHIGNLNMRYIVALGSMPDGTYLASYSEVPEDCKHYTGIDTVIK
jgi:hypothetical protein